MIAFVGLISVPNCFYTFTQQDERSVFMKTIKYPSKLLLFLSGRLLYTLLILAQSALLIALIILGSRLLWLDIALCAFSILTALHLFTRSEKYAIRMSWMFLVLLAPPFGGVVYWVLYLQRRFPKFRKKAQKNAVVNRDEYRTLCTSAEPTFSNAQDRHFLSYWKNTTSFPIYQNTDIRYLGDGKEMLLAMLEDLKTAQKFIFLEYYTIAEGVMWNSILDILRERAAAGVDVRVIYDDFGSFLAIPANYRKTLRSYGIQCQVFNRFSPRLTTLHNNRDHRKITVIDGKIAYTGGINVADEYINEKSPFGHWRDAAVRMQGAAPECFTAMFLQTWQQLSGKRETLRNLIPARDSDSASSGWIQPYSDDPMGNVRVGERIFNHAITRTEKTLLIATPYLMIGEEITAALKYCAQSGVDVRIVTPGIPDKKAVFFTTRSYYRELLAAGVKIYEYTPGFVHAKLIVSDDDFCVVGSTNIDFRSFYINRECGICYYGGSMVADVKKDIFDMISVSREIGEADCKNNVFVRFLQNVCRIFAPLM